MRHLTNINQRITKDIASVTNAGALNSVPVTAHWRELQQPSTGPQITEPDPFLVSFHDELQWQERSQEFTALVHYVDHTSSSYAAFKEIATGDVIVDYPSQVGEFQEKSNVRFLIGGAYYIPKKIGNALRDSWDVQGMIRTLLLTRQP